MFRLPRFCWLTVVLAAALPRIASAQGAPPPGNLPILLAPVPELLGTAPLQIGYTDRWDVPLDSPDSAAYYIIYRHYTPDSAGYFLRMQQYAVPGNRLVYDGCFKRKQPVGVVRSWHLNGKPYSAGPVRFVDGDILLDGPYEETYPSGAVRYRATFRRGKPAHATYFTQLGEAAAARAPYFEHAVLPTVGGNREVRTLLLRAFTKEAARVRGVSFVDPQQLGVAFRIDSLGQVRNLRVFSQTAPPSLRAVAAQLVRGLGTFEPARHHGEPSNQVFFGLLFYPLPTND